MSKPSRNGAYALVSAGAGVISVNENTSFVRSSYGYYKRSVDAMQRKYTEVSKKTPVRAPNSPAAFRTARTFVRRSLITDSAMGFIHSITSARFSCYG